MKSLKDLKKIHDAAQSKIANRGMHDDMKILVGMSTCGISAGAQPVIDKFIEKIAEYNLKNVSVTPVGCIGECAIEPIVDIYAKIRVNLERVGLPIGQHDLLIAAHALCFGLIVVTANEREFSRVEDLVVDNWLID
jgi:NADP-reducing hydrogenase subunit HndB